MAKKKHELAFAGSQEALWRPALWSTLGFGCTVLGFPVITGSGQRKVPVSFPYPVQLGDDFVEPGVPVWSSYLAVHPIGPVARALCALEDDDAAAAG